MKKRVLHIISSLQRGGAETLLTRLVGRLTDFDQRVFYFYDGPLRAEIEQLGIPTKRIGGGLGRYDPLFFYDLYREIQENRPDLIASALWSANFFAIILGKLLTIPVVAALHAQRSHEGRLRNILDRSLLAYAGRLIAVSGSVARSFTQEIPAIAGKLVVIENGIPLGSTLEYHVTGKPAHQTQQLAAPKPKLCFRTEETSVKNTYVVGGVGRLVPVKNFDLLIRAVSQLLDEGLKITLIIIGSGPEEHKLQKLIEQLARSESIQLPGEKKASEYYQFFDCFVQPSQSEGLSMALLEALSYKLPVIVSGKNHSHDVIEHQKTGWVVEPTVASVKEAIRYFYHHSDNATAMGLRGYQLCREKYDICRVARDYQKIFRALMR